MGGAKAWWGAWLKRIWAGHHANAPAARTCGLFEAEEDHRRQLGEGHHQGAQVAPHAHVVSHLLDDVVGVHRAVLLAGSRPGRGRGGAPQRRRTLLAHHGGAAEICETS